jgi:heterodisulfide reductase subunit A2
VQTGKRLGRDFSLTDLERQGFKAVFLGIGAHLGLGTGIAGEDEFDGVINAVDFLREVNLGSRRSPGKKVVVIGGGNVAVDAARVARRLGSESVTIVYRRSREEMPAYAEEIQDALAEGVHMHYLTAPARIVGLGGRVTGFECIRTELGPPDASGRRRPVPIKDSEFLMTCDAVLPAIGQRIDLNWAADGSGPDTTRRSTIRTRPHTMQTSIPSVFAAGDAVSGPASVIEAVAAGHKAVAAIERFINGEDLDAYAAEMEMQPPPGTDWADLPRNMRPEMRVESHHLAVAERVTSFAEVDRSFTEADARREARRCLNCGVCCECMECVRACEAVAIDHGMAEREVQVKVGSIILATGYDTLDPTPMKPFGYGVYPNVFTALEFERLSNATGPTGGKS